MDLNFLAQADLVTLRLEKARRLVEFAKTEMESAKHAFDEVLAKADEYGIPKVKLKKLTEERIAALFEAGMVELGNIEFVGSPGAVPRVERPKKKKAKDAAESVEATVDDASTEAQTEIESADTPGIS